MSHSFVHGNQRRLSFVHIRHLLAIKIGRSLLKLIIHAWKQPISRQTSKWVELLEHRTSMPVMNFGEQTVNGHLVWGNEMRGQQLISRTWLNCLATSKQTIARKIKWIGRLVRAFDATPWLAVKLPICRLVILFSDKLLSSCRLDSLRSPEMKKTEFSSDL